jgi:hypothetical protein
MRNVCLPLAAVLLMLSACGRVIVFGHTVGQKEPAGDAVPSVPPAPPQTPSAPQTVPPDTSPPQEQSAAQTPPVPPPLESPAAASTAPASSPIPQKNQIGAVSISFTPEAEAQVAAEPAFNRDALLAAIRADLRAHQLLGEASDVRTTRAVGITVQGFVARPASNAVVLGFVIVNASLSGQVQVSDVGGQSLGTLDIKAERRLSAHTEGKQAPPLGPLYQRFADAIVSQLTGTPIKPTDEPKAEMPR